MLHFNTFHQFVKPAPSNSMGYNSALDTWIPYVIAKNSSSKHLHLCSAKERKKSQVLNDIRVSK